VYGIGRFGAATFAADPGPGRPSTAVVLGFYAAIIWVWTWHAALSRDLRNEAAGAPSLSRS
jgi:hypothetical protein